MKSKSVAIGLSTLTMLIMALLIMSPTHTEAQKRRVKKKVVRTSPARAYAAHPRRGAYIRTVPRGARLVSFRNISYRFSNGIFYKPHQGQFVVVAPPVGIRITTLPVGFRTIVIRKRSYFYYYGTYYVAKGREFEVVQAPLGALVQHIPEGYEEIEIEGNTYYVLDQVQYKATIHQGEVWYEVIKVG